ncbi:SCO family protein [Streptomyces beihaiensis]|uniref:SCO family protein n=1 Tax=Streptomyces beihaiensis TaxID=2984495 RepID=A0ABT3TQV0_9ACTN|nr:SCO family protein [Streptomyces beihaiensis]MCX3058480.1 SCO family protein [Streptomyces beihaiensis]
MHHNTKPGKKRLLAATGLAAAAALTLSACGSGSGDGGGNDKAVVTDVSGGDHSQDKAVTVLDTPFEKPDLTLTDTHGKKFDLRKETDGKPTLVYFGYTHCPDVCPLTMSNIAVAKKSLPEAERSKLQVVFVSTDPDRDTPAELGKWLTAQDPAFIGMTGDFKTTQAAARSLGISVEPTHKDKNGKLVSTHGTQVIAFSPKTDKGYLLFDKDATVETYTHDIPKILKGEKP